MPKIKMLQKFVFVILAIVLKRLLLQQSVFAQKVCNIFLQQNCCKNLVFATLKIVAKKKAIVAKKKTYGLEPFEVGKKRGNLFTTVERKKNL